MYVTVCGRLVEATSLPGSVMFSLSIRFLLLKQETVSLYYGCIVIILRGFSL
jgi:hypothetical protein